MGVSKNYRIEVDINLIDLETGALVSLVMMEPKVEFELGDNGAPDVMGICSYIARAEVDTYHIGGEDND